MRGSLSLALIDVHVGFFDEEGGEEKTEEQRYTPQVKDFVFNFPRVNFCM